MIHRLIVPGALIVGGAMCGVGGCGSHPAPPTPVVKLETADPMRMSKATEDGDYVILNDAGKSMGVHGLKAGDDLGFRREDDHVIAVAGAQEIALPKGNYTWNRR
jgi:hypothetical protein